MLQKSKKWKPNCREPLILFRSFYHRTVRREERTISRIPECGLGHRIASPLKSLAHEMGSSITVLHLGRVKGNHLLRLESANEEVTPDAAVRTLCRTVEQLSTEGRKIWDSAKRKEFNVGYDSRSGVRAVELGLLPNTVKSIAALGASVGFTCYRNDDTE